MFEIFGESINQLIQSLNALVPERVVLTVAEPVPWWVTWSPVIAALATVATAVWAFFSWRVSAGLHKLEEQRLARELPNLTLFRDPDERDVSVIGVLFNSGLSGTVITSGYVAKGCAKGTPGTAGQRRPIRETGPGTGQTARPPSLASGDYTKLAIDRYPIPARDGAEWAPPVFEDYSLRSVYDGNHVLVLNVVHQKEPLVLPIEKVHFPPAETKA